MAARSRPFRARSNFVGLLDVGTSKTVCLVAAGARGAEGQEPGGMRVLGAGHSFSRGLKAGVVVELDAAEQSVRAAVAEAERAAGVSINDVFLAVSCGQLASATFIANSDIQGTQVQQADIERLTTAGRSFAEREGRTLVHMNHIAYRLDGAHEVPDPRGMAGRSLLAEMHAVTVDETPLANMMQVIGRAYLRVAGLAPAPYASGLAATTRQERKSGVLCVDMGAGATTLAVFVAGHLIAVDTVPVGGHHVTFDIARRLSMPLAEAERIKTLCGTLTRTASDDQEILSYTLAGEVGPATGEVTKGSVREIASARVGHLFRNVAERLERSGAARYAIRQVVLTGGASQLTGVCELAAELLGRPVRIGQMETGVGWPAQCRGPALSAAAGLLQIVPDPKAGVRAERTKPAARPAGYWGRVGQWLSESF